MHSMRTGSIVMASAVVAAVLFFGCAGKFGDSQTWKRACGTNAQREADSQACLSEAAGLVDPSGRGVEYAQGLIRECMESRGWQRLPSGTTLKCE